MQRHGEEAGEWRRLHNVELHNLYISPNVSRVIKSRRMGWTGHVTRMGKMINAYTTMVAKLEGKDYSKDLGVDGTIILEWKGNKVGRCGIKIVQRI